MNLNGVSADLVKMLSITKMGDRTNKVTLLFTSFSYLTPWNNFEWYRNNALNDTNH